MQIVNAKAICCPHREASSVLIERDSEKLAPRRRMVMGGLVECLVVEISIAIVVVTGCGGGLVGDAAIIGLVELVIVHIENSCLDGKCIVFKVMPPCWQLSFGPNEFELLFLKSLLNSYPLIILKPVRESRYLAIVFAKVKKMFSKEEEKYSQVFLFQVWCLLMSFLISSSFARWKWRIDVILVPKTSVLIGAIQCGDALPIRTGIVM